MGAAGAQTPEPVKPARAPVKLGERAYRWFFAPVDGGALELARIGFGLILLATYLRYLPYLAVVFGPAGIGGHDTLARTPDFAGLGYQAFAHLRFLDGFDSFAPIVALYLALLVAAACFTLGLATRWTGAAAALLHLAFTAHNPHLRAGWSWLLAPFTLYVAAVGSDARLSLGAWWRKRRGLAEKSALVAPWGWRLLQIHACTMYLAAGWERLDAPGWLKGDMVLHSLLNTGYGRFNLDWFALRPALTVAAYLVFLLEPLAPILLWLRPINRYFLVLLIAMHLGIEAGIEVGWWQWLMLVALTAFFPREWIDRIMPRRLQA